MGTHVPGFQSFSGVFFLHHFALARLANSSIRVKAPPRESSGNYRNLHVILLRYRKTNLFGSDPASAECMDVLIHSYLASHPNNSNIIHSVKKRLKQEKRFLPQEVRDTVTYHVISRGETACNVPQQMEQRDMCLSKLSAVSCIIPSTPFHALCKTSSPEKCCQNTFEE